MSAILFIKINKSKLNERVRINIRVDGKEYLQIYIFTIANNVNVLNTKAAVMMNSVCCKDQNSHKCITNIVWDTQVGCKGFVNYLSQVSSILRGFGSCIL